MGMKAEIKAEIRRIKKEIARLDKVIAKDNDDPFANAERDQYVGMVAGLGTALAIIETHI